MNFQTNLCCEHQGCCWDLAFALPMRNESLGCSQGESSDHTRMGMQMETNNSNRTNSFRILRRGQPLSRHPALDCSANGFRSDPAPFQAQEHTNRPSHIPNNQSSSSARGRQPAFRPRGQSGMAQMTTIRNQPPSTNCPPQQPAPFRYMHPPQVPYFGYSCPSHVPNFGYVAPWDLQPMA